MTLLEPLLAGCLCWLGLPPADWTLVRLALSYVPGADGLTRLAGKKAGDRK